MKYPLFFVNQCLFTIKISWWNLAKSTIMCNYGCRNYIFPQKVNIKGGKYKLLKMFVLPAKKLYVCDKTIHIVYLQLNMHKKRHNELRKKRNARNKRRKERLKGLNSFGRKYMFQEYLVNCEDALASMIPANGRIYRLAHKPNVEIDLYPTSLWDYETLAPKEIDMPPIIPANSSLEDQQNQLREYTPSFNVSVEGAIKPFIERIEKMKTLQQFSNFKNRKGSHIFAYDLDSKDGLMWIESDGHVALLPYEDFSLSKHLAEGFTPIPIEKFNKNINKLH